MAYTTHPVSTTFGATLHTLSNVIGSVIKGVFDRTALMMEINSTAHLRLAQAERLQAKSDAELSEMGIKRHEIAHYVFRDLFWN